ncbi:U3 small nucleolar ribonucleo protein complex, subunit Mpp10 [Blyttiomyces helicus]|uniref:U3 small nucleolar ribonucleoprotein protein MPP10 n=1 Tax=Blyttiomyces helicus TaxID=388810 RepID=A0A4P9WNL8_9FUNG|nr:U3 small nucleolar ribonucleo protein complex, subunit Mpp10 [Blyttiomyces helicus]|eukprot:RKO92790.1 U3 small nucleolar ribonucleo protein complex, subunit Mpp10 [Blyttiomyces helicus]
MSITPPIPALRLDTMVEKPERFFNKDESLSAEFRDAARWLFGVARQADSVPRPDLPFTELLVDGFDAEAVWEQIHMANSGLVDELEEVAASIGEIEGVDGSDAEEMEVDVAESGEDDDDLEVEDEDEEDADLDMDEDVDEEDDEEEEDEEGLEEEEEELHSEEDLDAAPKSAPRKRKTVVDDAFFSLEEMERFAEQGEARDLKRAKKAEGDSDDEDGDDYIGPDDLTVDPDELVNSDEDSDNANDINYEDFFGPRDDIEMESTSLRYSDKLAKRMSQSGRGGENDDEDDEDEESGAQPIAGDEEADDDEEGEEKDEEEGGPGSEDEEEGDESTPRTSSNLFSLDDDDEATGPLSTFEKNQLKMRKTIEALEEEAMAEKAWTHKGEVSSRARPMNSLLEEDLEIEHAAKPVPVITEENTATLEDLIRQRIKDQLWDDVVRKAAPRDREYDPNRRIEINEEKSTKSLAELYETDYLRQTGGAAAAAPTEKDEALAKQHAEIDTLFAALCTDLDALSNWHYTPKPARAELEVLPLPSVPAIQMEEVTPATVSDATLVTPREVFDAQVGKSAAEMDATDRKKARLREKRKMKKERAERERERKAFDAARPDAVARVESVKKGKEKALEQLMGQKNVTVIADAKTKKSIAAGKGKKGREIRAKVVEKGAKLGEKGARTDRAEMLRL